MKTNLRTITKKLQVLPTFVLTLSLLAWTGAHAQITPSADSYTNTADSTTNYGSQTLLDVDGASQITYIQFNLASIPTTASISQATLKLYVNSVTTAGSFNVDYVNSAWSESTIDASNAPPLGATIASNVNVTTAEKNQYILVNVTSAVQEWLSGDEANNGLALVANSTFNATFDSKENTATSHPPELDIAFAGGEGTITGVTTASGSGLTGGGTSGTLDLSLTHACAAKQVLQWSGSAWACSNAGTGTITGVKPGTGLSGGGTSGTVTLNNTGLLGLTAGTGMASSGGQTPTISVSGVPILAANNYFTQNNLFEPFNTDAIDAYAAWPGKTALVAIQSATSGGSYGVWARTSDPTGAGVKGTNIGGTGGIGVYGTGDVGVFGTGSSYGFQTDSNVQQARTAGGWVKAMMYVNASTAPYTIVRCFNSTLAGAAATTPPCGITFNEVRIGTWEFGFNFEVDDRFWSATLDAASESTMISVGNPGPDTLVVSTFITKLDNVINYESANFSLIVF